MQIYWIGTGVPRKLCKECDRLANSFDGDMEV